MSRAAQRIGVLLVNLGSPASPSVPDVRRFLREFLGDPRVLDVHPLWRWILLNLVILPRRPRTSAHAYASIWMREGSPLLVHSRALRDALAKELGPSYVVALGMRYGSPSIEGALRDLADSDVDRVVAVPLFPQYASSSTGSALQKVLDVLGRADRVPEIRTLGPFYDHPAFVSSLARLARPRIAEIGADHVLMSYHGLPERQVRWSDPSGARCLVVEGCCDAVGPPNRSCYRAQCFATSRALAAALGLSEARYTVSFQSRLGRSRWIEPYTDVVLRDLARRGARRLAVVCPSFVADCLETLEEIGMRARAQWREEGGEELALVPCVNADPVWVRGLAEWIRSEGG
jgi:ferrochelatase